MSLSSLATFDLAFVLSGGGDLSLFRWSSWRLLLPEAGEVGRRKNKLRNLLIRNEDLPWTRSLASTVALFLTLLNVL